MIDGLLWGLLPTLAAVSAILVSLGVAVAARRPIHYLTSGIVIALTVWSIVILYRIFILGAWPLYLPHIAITLSVLITAIQFAYRKTNK